MTTKGRHYYNNGKVAILLKPDDEIPEGFVKGGLPQSEEHKKQQSETLKRRYKNGEIVVWNKGKKGVQIPWNKGKKGVQVCSEETRKKISENTKGKTKTEEHKRHISEGRLKKHITHSQETKKKLSEYFTGKHFCEEQKIEIQQKQHITKSKNHSFNTSVAETLYFQFFKSLFDDFKYQYYDEIKYPFFTDFYIPQLDLYIECNFYPSHGKHPYGFDYENDLLLLEKWKNKQKTYINDKGKIKENSYFLYEKIFTQSDPKKLLTAITNKLNYLLLYRNQLWLFIGGVLVYQNFNYNFSKLTFMKNTLQKLASINGWTVVTLTEVDGTQYNKLYKPDETLVTAEELAKGVEKLIEVYKIEKWTGEVPQYQMGENGIITIKSI